MFTIIFLFLCSCVRSHTLQITRTPSNAVVLINGIPSCYEESCIQTLEQGVYDVDIRAENYVSESFSIKLHKDYTKQIHMSPKGGWISVQSTPTSLPISVDGALLGRTPIQRVPISIGKHGIDIHDSCFVPETRTIEVSSGQTVEMNWKPLLRKSYVRVSLLDEDKEQVGVVYADGIEVGTTLQPVSIPMCTQHLMVLAKDGWGQKTLDVLEHPQSTVVLEQQALKEEEVSIDGLLGFEPPECIHDGVLDKGCVRTWFTRIRIRAEEKNAHIHHEGCAHE